MRTEDKKNIKLAEQLAKGQGWTEKEFKMYRNLL